MRRGFGTLVRGHGRQWLAAFLMGLIFAVLAGTQAAKADDTEALIAATGFDISWPQCDGNYPNGRTGSAIVGVTGGKAFTKNRCLRSQWAWAERNGLTQAVYINVNSPAGSRLLSAFGPAGICRSMDTHCRAENYGYNSARYAVSYARDQGVTTDNFWLDVETMNRWSPDTAENARVIEGAIKYLEREDLNVGVYSTPYQWGVIAGDYAPGLPVWTAGASDLFDAQSRCTPRFAFGGGEVVMVQWVEVFDRNWVCPEPQT